MMITVNTEIPYPVHLGRDLFPHLEEYADFSGAHIVFLVDSKLVPKVNSLYGDRLIIPLDLSQEKKDFHSYEKIIDILRENHFSVFDWLINVGGGTISDLGSFVASTYKRGIRYLNVPTTTLAQIDAAVGGKNGLDVFHTKNLIGSIYQPQMVITDFDFLSSLPTRHFNNGLYEALKLALLFDHKLLTLLEAADFNDHIEEITRAALKQKIAIVEEDEFDKNKRQVLNFGHTIGHALESCTDTLLHGEAIMYGMMMLCEDRELCARLETIAKRWQLPPLPKLDHNLLTTALINDKKSRGTDSFTCIDLKGEQDWKFQQLTLTTLHQRIHNYEQSNW